MTFQLRDRPDGQVEIIIQRPVLVGVFPEREMAERICSLLQEDELFGQVDDRLSGFATASADASEAAEPDLLENLPTEGVVVKVPKARAPKYVPANLPAVIDEKLRPPAHLPVVVPAGLTEAQLDAAFARIANGEKMASVALSVGIRFHSLRGMWANHCRKMQAHMAEGGKIACTTCAKPFTPSLTSPEKCARCSHV